MSNTLNKVSTFDLAFEYSVTASIITDIHGNIYKANNPFTELLGYTTDELIHLTTIDLIPPGSLKAERTKLINLINNALPQITYTSQRLHKTGKPINIKVNAIAIYTNDEGKPDRILQ